MEDMIQNKSKMGNFISLENEQVDFFDLVQIWGLASFSGILDDFSVINILGNINHQFFQYSKEIIQIEKQLMILSRTRKQIKNMESFYKEAGLDQQIKGISEKNVNNQVMSKKDRMFMKKKIKQDLVNKEEVKTTTDKLQSDASQESVKEPLNIPHMPNLSGEVSEQSTLPLDKIINKISILQVIESKTVVGCYGHTTVVFKKPIIEGQYYIEFKILQPNLNEAKAKIKYPPSVRIGICPADYPRNTPLGQHLSIGYKSSTGKLVYQGVQHEGGQAFSCGDVIGLGMKFSPPHKYQNPESLWQQSQIVITKNGQVIKTCDKIHQIYYCLAFSLFNYASLEVRYERTSIEYLIQGFKPYQQIFNEKLNDEYLKNTSEFTSSILIDI